MKEQELIENYPKICGWFGMKWGRDIDFLHDADQREWIENRLIELGYVIATVSDIEGTNVTIYKRDEEPVNAETTSAKSKPIVFLQAVMELINQEDKK